MRPRETSRFRLVVPQSKPSAGLVIYDEAVRESAQVRVDLALSAVSAEGIEATGEVGDGDPFLATMDAVAERRPDAIIVSTHPAEHSGWLRRDLIERIHNATGLPVEHIVVDLAQRGAAVQRDAGARQQDRQRRGAPGAPPGDRGTPRTAPVHRGGAPGRRQRPRTHRGTRAPGERCSTTSAPPGCSARE